MQTYKLTVFEPTGEKVIDEAFEAKDHNEAKERGEKLLSEKGALEKTHRCTSANGELILFHP